MIVKGSNRRFILAVLLALGTASCGGTEQTSGESGDTSATGDTTTAEPAYELPKADFGGRDVNFYLSSNRSLFGATEENGDTINDAVYRRNRKVEELYNVNFKYTMGSDTASDFPKWYATAEASIMAADNSIDIMGGYFYRMAAITATSELFTNLMELEQVDFSREWWLGDLQESAVIGSKLYITAGNIDPGFYNRIYALVFNKGLIEKIGTGDMYELVKSGKWTFDQLKSIAQAGTSDLNGNAQMDDKDQYGYLTGNTMSIDGFTKAFDLQFTDYNTSGEPQILGLTEKLADAAKSLKEFVLSSGNVCYVSEESDGYFNTFEEGRAAIAATSLQNLQNMRSYDVEFGIIPYPKWNEAQKDYISRCATDPTAGYCVPITTDPKLAGCLFEALAYYGWQDVYPEYYERALKSKNTRDDESAAMLDIIFGNLSYSVFDIYSYSFGDQKSPSMLLRMTIRDDKDIASTYAADETLYKTTIQNLIDALK